MADARVTDRPMNPVFGVENYLKGKGETNFSQVTEKYFEQEMGEMDPNHESRCEAISSDFGHFVKWYGKYSKNKK